MPRSRARPAALRLPPPLRARVRCRCPHRSSNRVRRRWRRTCRVAGRAESAARVRRPPSVAYDASYSRGPRKETAMIELVIDQRTRDLGGFEVGRVLPFAKRRMVGPFIFFDHFGPIDFAPGIPRSVDVRPHPHIGLSTVTYLFEGEIMHRDSVGSEQTIRPGEMNWMTAGRGITHSERFEKARARGDRVHGLQAWVALPLEQEETEPRFAHHGADDLPTYESGGLRARLLAGTAFGAKAKVKISSPLFYVHWSLAPGTKAQLPAEYPERAAYVVDGEVEVEG